MKRWLVLGLVACGGGSGGDPGDELVGRVCDPGDVSPNETVLASPSLDCTTKVCLQIANSTPPMCTAECTDASDCQDAAESACPTGFACAPALSVGPSACKNFCICSDRVPFTSCP